MALRLICLLLAAFVAPAQETRSMIFGNVTDPASAAIPEATVTVTNTDTNTSLVLTTNQTGYYEANLLLPGNYRVQVEAAGFKRSVRDSITLRISSRIEISVQLQVGGVSESVTVSADAPLLDTSTVASGRVIDNRSVMELPVLANSPMFLARMTPGVQTGGVNARWGLHSNSVGGGYDVQAGGNVGGNEYTVDGVPNMTMDRRPAQLPYADTVLEFKVETSNFDASVGHTSNLAITTMTRAGTNELHGIGTWEHWQQRWQGAPFFTRQVHYRNIAAAEAAGNHARAEQLRGQNYTLPGRYNNLALSFGGPVVLPKIYNGKNKLFFYFSATGVRTTRTDMASNITYTVPTAANLQGDFSNLLAVDPRRYQIYDPLTIRADSERPGHFVRSPIPGNILPKSRIINPAYSAYAGFLPAPNNNPLSATAEPTNNYIAVNQPNMYDYYAVNHRMDYHASDKHRFFGKWTWNDFDADTLDFNYETKRGLSSLVQHRDGIGATIDWVYTMSPQTVLDVAVAGNTFFDGTVPSLRETMTAADVGLPAYIDQQAGNRTKIPIMAVTGYKNVSGYNYPSGPRAGTISGKADLTHIRGAHSLRTGFDTRRQYRTGGGGGYTTGYFSFDSYYTRRNDDTFTPAGSLGHSWAAFMMGIPSSISHTQPDTYALYNPYHAWYVQDNWRISRKLSLNLGLRAEYELGMVERYDRTLGGFDFAAKLPITDGAQAAYAAKPIPELAASAFRVAGGSLYVGSQGASRKLNKDQWMWMPRAGVAYQINDRTVLRGGYGIYYDTINAMNFGVNQVGYGSSTSPIVSTDFGQTWLVGNPAMGIAPLSDPFPVRADGTRFDTAFGNALGLMAVAGSSFSFLEHDIEHARQQRWRIGIQRQIGVHTVVEVAYSGSYSDNVYISKNLNPLAEEYWAKGMVRDTAPGSNMSATVTNPFALSNFEDLKTSNPLLYNQMSRRSTFSASTIAKNRLLRPYPHMANLRDSYAPDGSHRTDDLQVSLERRFSNNFNLNVAYTRLRSRAKGVYLNEFDPEPTWVESNNGRPHRFAATSVVTLPFGKGQPLLNGSRIWSALTGGFQVSATYEWQPGPLIGWGNLFYYGDLDDIRSGERTLDRWFNTDQFERTASKGPASYHVRVFPDRIEGVRADMTNQWNLNVQREFRVKESVVLQLRVDCLNVQNRSQFAAPTVDPYSTNFGRITTQTDATNRFWQVQARLRF